MSKEEYERKRLSSFEPNPRLAYTDYRDNETKRFNEYLYVWLGQDIYNQIYNLSNGFHNWNHNFFEILTAFLDLYRKENVIKKDGNWLVINITDKYIISCVRSVAKYLDIVDGHDLEINCPHVIKE